MPLFEWNENYSVHIPSIDMQHKQLLGHVNDLFDSLGTKKDTPQQSARILRDLIDYAHEHFTHEEKLFEKHAYPDAVPHKAQHDALLEQIETMARGATKGERAISTEIAVFLKDWVLRHILETDMRYRRHFAEKNVT